MSTATYSCTASCPLSKVAGGDLKTKEDVVTAIYKQFLLEPSLLPKEWIDDGEESDEYLYKAIKEDVTVEDVLCDGGPELLVIISYETSISNANSDFYTALVKALSRVTGVSLIEDNFRCIHPQGEILAATYYWSNGEQIDIDRCHKDSICLDYIVNVLEVHKGRKDMTTEIIQEVVESTGRLVVRKKPQKTTEDLYYEKTTRIWDLLHEAQSLMLNDPTYEKIIQNVANSLTVVEDHQHTIEASGK